MQVLLVHVLKAGVYDLVATFTNSNEENKECQYQRFQMYKCMQIQNSNLHWLFFDYQILLDTYVIVASKMSVK